MLLCYDKSARRAEKRKALARKPSRMDLMQVEVGEDGEDLDRTWEVEIGIWSSHVNPQSDWASKSMTASGSGHTCWEVIASCDLGRL